MNIQNISAYDYRPGFSNVLMDHWRRFDERRVREELRALKARQPHMNAVRVTHSYDAYLRDPEKYRANNEKLLSACAEEGLGVICCLFNRFHDARLDCGGLYLESLVPGMSWAFKEGFYADFVSDICVRRQDERVIIWETCDKPFDHYPPQTEAQRDNHIYELRWLREMYCYLKKAELSQPVAISVQDWYDEKLFLEIARCCDIMLITPYYPNPRRTAEIMARDFGELPRPRVKVI